MSGLKFLLHTISLVVLTFAPAQHTFASPRDVVFVGAWDSIGAGNPTDSGGPGVAVGQKFVIRSTYDDFFAGSTNVPVLTSLFADSGNRMQTISLQSAGNSLDIFVPMEGLDSGSPVIYVQDELDHFPSFIEHPTLNFVNLSNISLTSNIIGLEFEGNFSSGAGFNFIRLFNTAEVGGPINMVSQIVNCGNINCATPAIAATDTNGLDAVDLVIDAGPNIVYNAEELTQTTSSSIMQSNNLGSARSDNEDFIDTVWSPTGTAAGSHLNDIAVSIVDSGLTTTTSMTSWNVSATEQLTGLTGSDSVAAVSYMNATPTGSATATPTGTDINFTLAPGDADLAVNAQIAGFEELTITALVDGNVNATVFFFTLRVFGAQSSSNAVLEAVFGAGAHTLVFTITDRAGAFTTTSSDFAVGVRQEPIFMHSFEN